MSTKSFQVEIDNISGNSWNELLTQFEDASIYQTWSYGAVRRGAGNLSHLVLKQGDAVVGCCQVTFNRMPVLNLGIAYVVWGPLWRRRGSTPDPDILAALIRELKREYALKRGYLLRLSPNVLGEHKATLSSLMAREGFILSQEVTPYRTLRLDLAPSLDDLRKNFLQKWRNRLNKAEKSDLNVVEGSNNELFTIFLTLVQEMIERKKFMPGVNYEDYQRTQNDLPEHLKMRIAVCEAQGEPIAVAICSAIGDTGIYILGASGDKGKGLNAAYLLHWRMIRWLKEQNLRWYDLGGIDPQGNPGVYEFKCGLAGKTGYDVEFAGEYHGSFALRARASVLMLKAANLLRRRMNHHSTTPSRVQPTLKVSNE